MSGVDFGHVANGLKYEVAGTKYIDALRLKRHPFFVATQFHPEYQSSRQKPHPIIKEFLDATVSMKYSPLPQLPLELAVVNSTEQKE